MYLYRVLAGTFSQVQFGQDVGISNDRFRQFLLYYHICINSVKIYEKVSSYSTCMYMRNFKQIYTVNKTVT